MISKILTTACLILALTACSVPPIRQSDGGAPTNSTVSHATAPNTGATTSLLGTLAPSRGYHVQLTNLLDEFARGATVSLIESSSGETRGTSLADASGSFVISFGSAFQPVPEADGRYSVPYIMEAIKGINGPNAQPNQAGGDLMRLRTIVWYDFTAKGWTSLTSATPGPISISLSTTTIAFFVSQKTLDGDPIVANVFMGALDPQLVSQAPGDYREVLSLPTAIYQELYTQVVNAVIADQDPIQALVLGGNGAVANTQTNFEVNRAISPTSGGIGTRVTLTGRNLEPDAVEVTFAGGVVAPVVEGSTATNLLVDVPPGARTGLIQIRIRGITAYTNSFGVTTRDGRSSVYTSSNGSTLVWTASSDQGTLMTVDGEGVVRVVNRGLSNPRAILVNPEGRTASPYFVYVADGGTGRIAQVRDDGTMVNASWMTVTDPQALALGPDGDLYVSEGSNNRVVRARVNWAAASGTSNVTQAALATYTGLSGPRAMAFDFEGNLYVVEPSADRVRRFKPASGESGSLAPSMLDWAYLAGPSGLAIDTEASCYVTSPGQNVIVKVDRYRRAQPFLTTRAPASISRDNAGNLYVIDQDRALVQRISLAGDRKILAYGLAYLRGIAADSSGNLFVALQESGAILKLDADGNTTRTQIAGIAAPYGLNMRQGLLHVTHSDNGNATEVNPALGTARSTIVSGLSLPGSLDTSDDGSTRYVGALNCEGIYQDSWWRTPIGEPYGYAGLQVADQNGLKLWRHAIHGTYDWNGFGQTLWRMASGGNSHLLLDRDDRKLLMITASGSGHEILDRTPALGPSGAALFPDLVYDLVYDGSRYAWVSCKDGKVWRLDLQAGTVPTATAITGFTGTPYGMTLLGGALYVVDQGTTFIRKITSPGSAVQVDAGGINVSGAGTSMMGLTTTGGNLYAADYGTRTLWRVAPSGASAAHVVFNGSPSRVRSLSNGDVLARVSDGVFYLTSTTGSAAPRQYASTIGCTGCGIIEYFIDDGDKVSWSQPRQHDTVGARGAMNLREIQRLGDWIYGAATSAVVGWNITAYGTGRTNGRSIGSVGNPTGIAVRSGSEEFHVLNTVGGIYSVNTTGGTFTVTGRATLPGSSGWGLELVPTDNRLVATQPGTGNIYDISTSTWSPVLRRQGLHAPIF
ncbi:MAG: IPT/TIG domain-containing protein [Candidatus Sericytochromatia bacterium]|nr:IPT/TIG domain-containing protein [Candidatus Sericytochromatia bacterium]